MPTPEPDRHEADEGADESQRPVAGTVRLMTEDPFDVDGEPAGLVQRVAMIATAKPWLIPAALLGIGVLFLLLRRRH